jgi:hypothetical protein
MQAFLKTPTELIFKFKGFQKIVSLATAAAALAEAAYKRGAPDEEILNIIDISLKIKNHPSGLFGIDGNDIYIGGEKLPNTLGDRVLDFAENGYPVKPLLTFWENCKLNPDPRAKTDLYVFLEKHGHPITSDGCFIGYRNVFKDKDGNLLDWNTKSFNNNVGQVVSMKREDCDANPDAHCSRGLHVAQLSYASTFHNESAAVLLEVKVNPKDVVAIPTDCNGEKMRVCCLEVIAINTEGLIKRSLYDESECDEDDDESEDEGGWDEYDDDEGEDDESGAVSNPVDFSKPQNKDDGVRIQTTKPNDNWKTQKRDSKGHFLPKGS